MILPYRQCAFYSCISSPVFTHLVINTRPLKSTSAHRNFQLPTISNNNMVDAQACEIKCRVKINHGIVSSRRMFIFGVTTHIKAMAMRRYCTFQFSDISYEQLEIGTLNMVWKCIKEIHCIWCTIRVTFVTDISLYMTYLKFAEFMLNPLKTKHRPLYLNIQSVPLCKHFSLTL